MSDFKGSGDGGYVLPDDLRVPFDQEAEMIGGNGRDPVDQDEEATAQATKLDVRRFDQLVDRLMRTMRFWLDKSDQDRDLKFDALQTFILRSVGVAGREQVAAAWSGPAEGMLFLAGVIARFGDMEEGEEFGRDRAAGIVDELGKVCAELDRATVKEEGKMSAIDEALGADGTLGERIEAVRGKVAEVQGILRQFVEGDQAPEERKVVAALGMALVDLARIFGATGDRKGLQLKPVNVGGDRGGPREQREPREMRAFRADFEVAMRGIRTRLGAQEWAVRILLLAVGLSVGWSVGFGGVRFGLGG